MSFGGTAFGAMMLSVLIDPACVAERLWGDIISSPSAALVVLGFAAVAGRGSARTPRRDRELAGAAAGDAAGLTGVSPQAKLSSFGAESTISPHSSSSLPSPTTVSAAVRADGTFDVPMVGAANGVDEAAWLAFVILVASKGAGGCTVEGLLQPKDATATGDVGVQPVLAAPEIFLVERGFIGALGDS